MLGVLSLLGMVVMVDVAPIWMTVLVYLVRTAAMNCTYPIQEAILMDYVPKSRRARYVVVVDFYSRLTIRHGRLCIRMSVSLRLVMIMVTPCMWGFMPSCIAVGRVCRASRVLGGVEAQLSVEY